MSILRQGLLIAVIIGFLWTVVLQFTITVALAFGTGGGYTPVWLVSGIVGMTSAIIWILYNQTTNPLKLMALQQALTIVLMLSLSFGQPFGVPLTESLWLQIGALVVLAYALNYTLRNMLNDITIGLQVRHNAEMAAIKSLLAFGYLFFVAIVMIPFYVMIMTSFKSQQALLINPLDFSLDWQLGWGLFRSYVELFRDYNFGTYLLNSFVISVLTVLITLLFSAPGAYAVARLKFKGRAFMVRGILLIYMVPLIVLALPIYIVFSILELRNSLVGILLIYPVTTIPVALYMLQGYFRGLPEEVEEAGLMDGLSRFGVVMKITLPLALPALASVSLYVFMIAWNEFLLAFMLLDDPSIFTLTRGVSMLNSSEIPRQHLMAGAVISTLPIMLIFLFLERFMTKGLTAGSVKG
ncbi:carbohydrate ABC transporter permease [Candidatus Njordibacter sp. Uisw_002]|jgi:multiple sugar transport system permease protein|uniref:carbohydrate ABC transporter permease n=1 Tax=Candidatus Njordibacter sp. Uisw_002 TaxID=3230971 RepID=UPI003D5615EB|tara:strand:+ start:1365 stop:2594 length:1230 start_codon:yes stop_codon:yes gene_type:complete